MEHPASIEFMGPVHYSFRKITRLGAEVGQDDFISGTDCLDSLLGGHKFCRLGTHHWSFQLLIDLEMMNDEL
jgi:hypothetical protein